MNRYTTSLFLMLWAAATGSAHFIWIVPAESVGEKSAARVIFSDNLRPDKPAYLAKISGMELFARQADHKITSISWTRGDDAYQATVPDAGPGILAGVCRYGVLQRGKTEPFLLMYYPKALLGATTPSGPSFRDACDRLPLEILPIKDRVGMFRALWRGKPLPDVEVVVLAPGAAKKETKKTDSNGAFQIDLANQGVYGVRVRCFETKEGEHDGKKYQSIRHYATLVFQVGDAPPKKATVGGQAKKASICAPLPTGVSSFGAVVDDGWLYVYGGHCAKTHHYSTDAVLDAFRRLKLSNPNAWEELPTGPRIQGLTLVAHAGKIYRLGGMQPRNGTGQKADNYSLPTCARFDPAVGKWEVLPDLPDGRSSHDAVVIGERIYVVGGWKMIGAGKKPSWHDTVCVLDLAKKPLQWESLPQPFQRRALTAVAFAGKIYVIAGMNKNEVIELTMDIFDPKKNHWSTGPSLPAPSRNGFAAASCVVDGGLYISPADGKVYQLSNRGDAWRIVGSLQQKRVVHRMVGGPDGRLIVLGGASKKANVAEIEVVKPAPSTFQTTNGGNVSTASP